MPSISAEIDLRGVQALADQLRQVDALTFGRAGIRAVNTTMDEVFPIALDLMIGGINMTETEARKRMTLEPANDPRQPQARIIAKASDSRGTTLASYGAKLMVKPVNWSNARIKREGGEFGPWPKWTPRDGDEARNIGAGFKYAGFTASVRRGVTTQFPTANTYATLIPVRGRLLPIHINKGVKRGKGRLGNAVYGPSVRQLFRHNLAVVAKRAETELEDNFARELNAEVEKVLR